MFLEKWHLLKRSSIIIEAARGPRIFLGLMHVRIKDFHDFFANNND